MSRTRRMLAAAVVAAGLLAVSGARGDLVTHGSTTITMEFVTIGSAGNAADPATGGLYGSVGYDYRIGTYEVSVAQWATVNTAAGIGDAGGPWTGSQPVASISWNNAALYCNWLTSGDAYTGYYTITGTGDSATATPNGLSHDAYAAANGTTYFLPTEDEWYKAAYYSATGVYYDYPTGSNTAPTDVLGGTSPFTAVYDGPLVNPAAPASVDNSGGLSPFLTMGQGGNVWEWNETLIGGSSRGLRGGSFGNDDGSLRADTRGLTDPASEDYGLGFRVASIGIVPEPGSLGLLLLGLTGMVARRRRSGR